MAYTANYDNQMKRSDDLDVDDGITSIDDDGDVELEEQVFAQGRSRPISVSAMRA